MVVLIVWFIGVILVSVWFMVFCVEYGDVGNVGWWCGVLCWFGVFSFENFLEFFVEFLLLVYVCSLSMCCVGIGCIDKEEKDCQKVMVKKDGVIEVEGCVVEFLFNVMFCIELENGYKVFVYISGKMCQYYICILFEDWVVVELLFYDLFWGCIVYWYKQ